MENAIMVTKRFLSTDLKMALCVLSLCAVAGGAAAQAAAPKVSVQSVVEVERNVTLPDGRSEVRRFPVKSAPPGQALVFTNRVSNAGVKPADKLVLTNPVPQNMKLLGAWGEGAQITYSVDGGKVYAPPETLKVKSPKGDLRAASLEDYTHIRWQLMGRLPPGKSAAVGFRAQVR
jgi:uncharacterized repeat protein (TIGR01451 family)